MRRKTGFTLTEVAIAIIVIVVLLAILVPSLTNFRRSAQRAKCLSNLKQLQYAFNMYASDNKGLAFPSTASGGESWMVMLRPYATSTKVDGSTPNKPQYMSNICPRAVTGSADPSTGSGVGSASLAWGNTNQTYTGKISPIEPLVIGNHMGSYGLNSAITTNIGNYGAIGLISYSMDMDDTLDPNGHRTVYGDAWVKGSAAVRNYAQITGRLFVGGSAGVDYSPPVNTPNNILGGIFPVPQSSVVIPNVDAIYAALAARPDTLVIASIAPGTTLDFTKNPVIRVSGSASLANIAGVKGQGTLIFTNNASLPTKAWPINIVTIGGVGLQNGSLNGSLYMHNTAAGNGTGRINGNLVTMGPYNANDGPSIHASPPPDFDTTTPRYGLGSTFNVNSARVPAFADCIWAEGSPGLGGLPALDTEKGDPNTQLGRYYINRHSNATNVVFVDGHAETVPLNGLRTLKWSPQVPD